MTYVSRLKSFLNSLLDLVVPYRSNFAIVKNLNQKSFEKLPKAPNMDGMPWITSLFHYKNTNVRAIIWELKYRGNTLPLEHIGRLMFEEIMAAISDIILFEQNAQFVLIPVPISSTRRRERGYNQSEYIARAIVENDIDHTLLYAPQWFEKVKDTPRQSHSQSREERQHNLLDSFSANESVLGTYVILIDDVVTTGSTLSEARRTLLAGGAHDVYAFTIAH